MAISRRFHDDDDRPRRKRQRKSNFPIGVVVAILILVPLLAIGGYYAIKSTKSSSSSTAPSSNNNNDDGLKELRAKIIGDWYNDDPAGYRWELNIQENGQITIAGSRTGGVRRSESFTWKVVGGGKNQITIRITDPKGEREPFDYAIEVLPDQQLRVTPKAGIPPQRVYTKSR